MIPVYFFGCEGRISTRLTMVRAGIRRAMATTSATSSGAIIHSAPAKAKRY